VGIDDTSGNDVLLEQAFRTAARRDAALTVLHAWYIPSIYDEAILQRCVKQARAEVRSQIEQEMSVWRAAYPTVEAHLDLSHARPADALVAASEHCQLLLLDRRSAGHSLAHLGPVTRALIRESRCPVMVLPPAHAHNGTDQERDPRAHIVTS